MEYTNEQIIENRRIWEKALESGKYKKGKGRLRSENDEYCCLGVACELFGNEDVRLLYGRYLYGGYAAILTTKVVNALGLYGHDGYGKDCNTTLAGINDESDSFKPVIEAIKTGNYYKKLD